MSARLFKSDVLFLQRILKVSGFYDGPLDGKWNKAMDEADAKFDAEFEKSGSQLFRAFPDLQKRESLIGSILL